MMPKRLVCQGRSEGLARSEGRLLFPLLGSYQKRQSDDDNLEVHQGRPAPVDISKSSADRSGKRENGAHVSPSCQQSNSTNNASLSCPIGLVSFTFLD